MMVPTRESHASEYSRPLSPSEREKERAQRRRRERWLRMGSKFQLDTDDCSCELFVRSILDCVLLLCYTLL